MKNIMKKLFSLLLVGVVAVSMFGFITPNRVDAAEANAKYAGKFCISYVPGPRRSYTAFYMLDFYDSANNNIGDIRTGTLKDSEKINYKIPSSVQRITIQTDIVLDGGEIYSSSYSEYKRIPGTISTVSGQSVLYNIRSPFNTVLPGINETVGNGWKGTIHESDIF